tara:strand:- start:7307 stop:9202 length:1896 start_codon:yes stop_codon:yes gene_type:complete
MKLFTLTLLTLLGCQVNAQQSDDLIPASAVSVFSINNVSLLEKISLDELVKYEFMEEIQQELFDGSTKDKTLQDSGIDFDQKFNVFFGKGEKYEVSGFTFGVKNEDQLFEVFDDFEQALSDFTGVEFYSSYFNHIAIKGNSGILFRVTPNYDIVSKVTDSLWMAQGNEPNWSSYDYFDLDDVIDSATEETAEDETLQAVEEIHVLEEESVPKVDDVEDVELPIADEDPTKKTYYELRDSIEAVLMQDYLFEVSSDLFIKGNNLKKSTPVFAEQLTHNSEGIFYFDNGRFNQRKGHSYLFESVFRKIETLYSDNIILGDIEINDESIDLVVEANYNGELGSIYQSLSDAKFDKNVLKYIHKDNTGFFTMNMNMQEAYEQSYDIIMPMLEESDSQNAVPSMIVFEIFNEFIDQDALFDSYNGSMFGTYDGIKKVKTKKIVFDYDDETFEYTEEEVEAEEDMPIFTFGFTNNNLDFSRKLMRLNTKISDDFKELGDGVWVIKNGMMNSSPLYLIFENDLFIYTNNENLALNHSLGYGGNSLSKTLAKKAKKSNFLYGAADLNRAIEGLPKSLFNDKENEFIDVLKGKTGQVQLTSSSITNEKTSFKLAYNHDGESEDSAKYIIDLINSLYVNFK